MGNSAVSKPYVYAVEDMESEKKPNETRVYRHQNSMGIDLWAETANNTLQDTYTTRFVHNAEKKGFGYRKVKSDGTREEKITYITNGELLEEAEKIGSGMISLESAPEVKEWNNLSLCCAGIYAKNSYEYLQFDIACTLYGITIVPIYDTLGEEATIFAFNQTKMAVCAVSQAHVEKMLKAQIEKKTFPYLKQMIILDSEKVIDEQKNLSKQSGIRLLTLNEVKSEGTEKKPWVKVTPSSIYAFSYTSGTTGEPKGAMITHQNIICSYKSACDRLEFLPSDTYISYLPMAHIMERLVVQVLMKYNVTIFFYSGDILKLKEDLAVFKPTIFVSVPRLFNKFHDSIKAGINEKQGFIRKLVDTAIDLKIQRLLNRGKYTHAFYDLVVFKKFKNVLGGNVRVMVTGSAPISDSVLNLLKVCFCVPLIEAYGQTEGTGLEFSTVATDTLGGHVGGPVVNLEFKLVDVPEMNYHSTDTDDEGRPRPRGEIYVRGPSIIPGYYKQDEKNKETFTKDGWMISGDIAQIEAPQNRLKIIDRKKNIFKLSQGEYIAPEKLENIYRLADSRIAQIYIYGDSLHNFILAAISIEPQGIESLMKELNCQDQNAEDFAKSQELQKYLIEKLNEKAKEAKLNSLEKVKGCVVETRMLGELGLLTEAFKLKRIETRNHFKARFDQLYSSFN